MAGQNDSNDPAGGREGPRAAAASDFLRWSRWSAAAAAAVVVLLAAYFFLWAAPRLKKDHDFSQLCALAPFAGVESLGYRVSDLLIAARNSGRHTAWETTDDGRILRISWHDSFADESHELSLELIPTPHAAALPNCAGVKEGAVVTRLNFDGKIISGLAVGVTMQQLGTLLRIQPKDPAAEQPTRPAAPPPPATAISTGNADAGAPQDATRPSDSDLAQFTPDERRKIESYQQADDKCRGLPGDDPQSQAFCKQRDDLSKELAAVGVCFGRQSQIEAEFRWHRCGADSCGVKGNCQ